MLKQDNRNTRKKTYEFPALAVGDVLLVGKFKNRKCPAYSPGIHIPLASYLPREERNLSNSCGGGASATSALTRNSCIAGVANSAFLLPFFLG